MLLSRFVVTAVVDSLACLNRPTRTAILRSAAGLVLMFALPAVGQEVGSDAPDRVRVVTPVRLTIDKLSHQIIDLRPPEIRQAQGGCSLDSTHSSLNFEDFNVKQVDIVTLAETEEAAASFVLPASAFPLDITTAEIVFAQSATVDTTTKWSLRVWSGTPTTSTPATISSNGTTIPHLFIPAGNTAHLLTFSPSPAAPITVTDNGSHTFTLGFRIDDHNNQTQPNPCSSDPPLDSNAFPTLDLDFPEIPTGNWVSYFNCGPFGCPAGWHTGQNAGGCPLNADWNLRATYTPKMCPLSGACCLPNGDCLPELSDSQCAGMEGVFQGDRSVCSGQCPFPTAACCFEQTQGCIDLPTDFCGDVDGDPGGERSTCESFECFPTGACCKPNGFCVNDVSDQDCTQDLAGTYQGDNSTCAQIPPCPPPEGACCFNNSNNCFVLTEAECSQAPATWRGPATDCADGDNNGTPDDCASDPIGACCKQDFMCEDGLTSSDCTLLSGAYQGTGVTCADVGDECVAPTGACCLPTGPCHANQTAAACAADDGVYQGNGSSCASCSTQACCFAGAGCLNFPVTTCVAAGGTPQGTGSTCAGVICQQPVAACCFDTGLCLELTETQCSQGGASWQGMGALCDDPTVDCQNPPMGACCIDDDCSNAQSPAACSRDGGTYQGHNSTCATVNCMVGNTDEACCLPNGECLDLLPSDCAQAGGDPEGPGTVCATTSCPPPVMGACCQSGGSCAVTVPTQCTGSYQGDNTTCTPTNPCTKSCTVDVQCDDANECNGHELCDMIAGECLPGTPLNCEDGNICTENVCDPVSGCPTPTQINCDDQNVCTTDSCDALDGCLHMLINCDDGEFCTGDSCDATRGCIHDCQFDLVDDNCIIDAADLAILLGHWGPGGASHPANYNGDDTVDAADLALLLGNWGPCP